MNIQKTSIALSLAAINLTIGGIVSWLKLPIYLDSIGLIISTVLLGWRFGLLTGIVTVGVGFLVINPYLPAYSATLIALVTTTELLARKFMFRSIIDTCITNVLYYGLEVHYAPFWQPAAIGTTTYAGGRFVPKRIPAC